MSISDGRPKQIENVLSGGPEGTFPASGKGGGSFTMGAA